MFFLLKKMYFIFTEINNRKGDDWGHPQLLLITAICRIHFSSDKKTICQILSLKESKPLQVFLKEISFNFFKLLFLTGSQIGLNEQLLQFRVQKRLVVSDTD